MKWYHIILFASFISACTTGTQHRALSVKEKAQPLYATNESVTEYEQIITKFVEAASKADKKQLMTYMSPITKIQTRELPAILDKAITYFSDYKKLGNCAKAEKTRDEFSNSGYIYFREFITNNGQLKPFKIIVLRESGEVYVSYITPEKHKSGNLCFT